MQCKMTQIIIKYLTTYLIECLLEKKFVMPWSVFFLLQVQQLGSNICKLNNI